jgi:hypothetical protein
MSPRFLPQPLGKCSARRCLDDRTAASLALWLSSRYLRERPLAGRGSRTKDSGRLKIRKRIWFLGNLDLDEAVFPSILPGDPKDPARIDLLRLRIPPERYPGFQRCIAAGRNRFQTIVPTESKQEWVVFFKLKMGDSSRGHETCPVMPPPRIARLLVPRLLARTVNYPPTFYSISCVNQHVRMY